MLFEDIENIISLPEYKAYIKSLKDENREAETRSLRKLIDKIGRKRARKIELKALNIENVPMNKAWKKEADESSKVYKKYDKILDKNYKSENWKEYAENRQKKREELGEVWRKYKPSDEDMDKAREEGKAKKTKYLNKFNREKVLEKYIEERRKEYEKEGKKYETLRKLYEKYYDDDKIFKDTYKKLKEVNYKKFNLKVFDKYKVTYYFDLYHNIELDDRKVYFGAVWWEIENAETLKDSEWQRIDKYLRKNIFNIFCEKIYLNKKNLYGSTGTNDHDGCFIRYEIPRKDWEKLSPNLAARDDIFKSDGVYSGYSKRKEKDYKKRYKEILGKL